MTLENSYYGKGFDTHPCWLWSVTPLSPFAASLEWRIDLLLSAVRERKLANE